jgi:hypothetical protein
MARRERPQRPIRDPRRLLEAAREDRAIMVVARREVALERRALADERRMARREAREMRGIERANGGQWSGIAIGVGLAALAGVLGVIAYLLLRRRDGQLGGAGAPQVVVVNGRRERPKRKPRRERTLDDLMKTPLSSIALSTEQSFMKSVRLPMINDPRAPAVRIVASTDVPYRVVLRVISPPGSFGIFSMTPNELNLLGTASVPVGDTMAIPVGGHEVVYLMRNQALYGKGNVANVIVSINAIAMESVA